MSDQDQPLPTEVGTRLTELIAARWKLFFLQGAVIAILGLLAIAMPLVSTLAVEFIFGWLFLIGGVLRTFVLLTSRHLPGYWWSLGAAILAAVLGLVLTTNPLQGVLTLTIALMALFLVEGLSAIFASLDFRRHIANWGWLLFSGVIDLILVLMIWQGWPATAAWAIGLLTGINLFFLGLSLIMLALAARPGTT
jgi:uncharacterized membrane protein HdeD (DUF308 family)